MLAGLKRRWQRRCLKDERYADLFDQREDEIVSIDCETTSLKIDEAELLSIGAVKLRGNRILCSEAFYLLVRPTHKPDNRNVAIHGLRPRDVSAGEDANEAVRRLLAFIGGRPLLGYYLEYDVAILNKYIRPLIGTTLPNRQIELSGRYYDYKLKQNPGAYIDLRLNCLCEDLAVTPLARHDALNDAITTAMLYQVVRQRGFG